MAENKKQQLFFALICGHKDPYPLSMCNCENKIMAKDFLILCIQSEKKQKNELNKQFKVNSKII